MSGGGSWPLLYHRQARIGNCAFNDVFHYKVITL